MGKDTFDAILTSVPLNGTAGAVTGKGEHWEPRVKASATTLHWNAQPAMSRFTPDPRGTLPDLTGVKFGRFTVLGILDDGVNHTWRGLRWVVRCACGDFEARSTKAIRGMVVIPNEVADRCHNCARLVIIQKQYKTKGARPLRHFTHPREPT